MGKRAEPRDEGHMIELTRLNGHAMALNSDLIKLVEQAPDTVITLLSGEKIIVRETAQEVIARVICFRRAVLQGLTPLWDLAATGGARSPES
jgi:flagellar protein FlbD